MKIIEFFKNFWLDFFAAYYKRLKKNAAYEIPISIVLHVSFTQSVNFNTLLIIICHLFFTSIGLNFTIFFSIIGIFILFNSYYFYSVLSKEQRGAILVRKPRYKPIIYSLYSVFSTVLLVLVVIMASKGQQV